MAYLVILLLSAVITTVLGMPLHAARAPTVNLYVYSLECTQDIINDGSTETHQLTPEECEAILHPPPKPPQPPDSPPVSEAPLSPEDVAVLPAVPRYSIPPPRLPLRLPAMPPRATEPSRLALSLQLDAIRSSPIARVTPLAIVISVAAGFGIAVIIGTEMKSLRDAIKKIWRRIRHRR